MMWTEVMVRKFTVLVERVGQRRLGRKGLEVGLVKVGLPSM
jgi:hypothetical protein